jgi:hypothetical protein
MLVAAALLGGVAWAVWDGLDAALGRDLPGQAVSVLGAIAAGTCVYAAAVWMLGIPEARQIRALLPRRGG